jgi:RNA polymerase sigma-70 factor (ECF subfamily)
VNYTYLTPVTRVESPFAEDRALAAKGAAGDVASRERLVRRLMPRIRAVARRVLSGSAEADDAAQNSMLEVLRSLPTFLGQTSLEAWSDRICARVSIRQARQGRRWLQLVSPEPTMPDTPDLNTPSVEASDVGAHVKGLPDVQRQTIELKYGLGLSVDEIADAMSVSVNTVKTRLKAGLRGLRASMALNPAGDA